MKYVIKTIDVLIRGLETLREKFGRVGAKPFYNHTKSVYNRSKNIKEFSDPLSSEVINRIKAEYEK